MSKCSAKNQCTLHVQQAVSLWFTTWVSEQNCDKGFADEMSQRMFANKNDHYDLSFIERAA